MRDLDCENLHDCSDAKNVCLAHLATGRVPDCLFTKDDIKLSTWYPYKLIMSKKGDGLGQCQDWKPKNKEG